MEEFLAMVEFLFGRLAAEMVARLFEAGSIDAVEKYGEWKGWADFSRFTVKGDGDVTVIYEWDEYKVPFGYTWEDNCPPTRVVIEIPSKGIKAILVEYRPEMVKWVSEEEERMNS